MRPVAVCQVPAFCAGKDETIGARVVFVRGGEIVKGMSSLTSSMKASVDKAVLF